MQKSVTESVDTLMQSPSSSRIEDKLPKENKKKTPKRKTHPSICELATAQKDVCTQFSTYIIVFHVAAISNSVTILSSTKFSQKLTFDEKFMTIFTIPRGLYKYLVLTYS